VSNQTTIMALPKPNGVAAQVQATPRNRTQRDSHQQVN
jgi:hypothetical protein